MRITAILAVCLSMGRMPMGRIGKMPMPRCDMRFLINEDPFPVDPTGLPWSDRGQWPCSWVTIDPLPEAPFVATYRLEFEAPLAEVVRIHVTADQRYELWVDGEYIGRGSERGDIGHWFFETYELELSAGEHVLVAKVWSLGEKAPFAQIYANHGFLLCPQDPEWQERIGTGKAPWVAKQLPGYEWTHPQTGWGTGWNLILHGEAMDWEWNAAPHDDAEAPLKPNSPPSRGESVSLRTGGEGQSETAKSPPNGYSQVKILDRAMAVGVNDRTPSHLLRPAMLPAMLEQRWPTVSVELIAEAPEGPTNVIPVRRADDLPGERDAWHQLLNQGQPLTLPPHTRRRLVLDLEDYVCAYPRATFSGGKGASLRINWQESLYEGGVESLEKGNRDEVEGKFFNVIWHKEEGVGDKFISGGGAGQRFETLWWQAGRYVELLVETHDEPLTIDALDFVETHYPYEFEATFESSDERLSEIVPIMRRVLEMCSHETYMDCPYYEQLQYIGDTRLQVLVTYTQTLDDRLPRKAIRMFDASRQLSGLTQSRYPNRVLQIIPPFSLWWIGMLYDFTLWRGDLDFVKEHVIGMRGVLDCYRAKIDPADGLLGGMDGWNFVDWVPSWNSGMPKDAVAGKSSVLNLQLALALRYSGQIEATIGENTLALRDGITRAELKQAVNRHFWSEERGLYANDLDHTEFSEHAQCLALLADAVPDNRKARVIEGLLGDPDLDRTTIYFSHYLFETYTLLGRTDLILDRMALWFDHPKNGLKTTIEAPEPTRSDCHAWGAHPLYHYYASFLGIRPTGVGCLEVTLNPRLGGLTYAKGSIPTPLGMLHVSVDGDKVEYEAPDGMVVKVVQ